MDAIRVLEATVAHSAVRHGIVEVDVYLRTPVSSTFNMNVRQ